MGLLRVLVVAIFGVLAVIAGLFTAAAVGLATALLVFIRRLLRAPGGSNLPNAPRRSRPRANVGEVIDVTATEVPAESTRH
jgi:MFS superfamily sulfate permease-like transporter